MPASFMVSANLKRQFSTIENWPGWLFTTPLTIWWFLLGFRYMSITLPTIANPRMPLGGLCGESKTVLLNALGPIGKAHLAPFILFTTSTTADEAEVMRAEGAMDEAGLAYPLIIKPDVSRNGTGVQILRSRADLAEYLQSFPRETDLIFQKLITDRGEAGVFYIRLPGEAHGRITSLTIKIFPSVTGDGTHTLRQLICAEPRAGQLTHLYFPRLEERLDTIPAVGETVPLVSVGNHAKGAIFEDGEKDITPEMEKIFDEIAQEMQDFRFGRFDVRYSSLEELKKGKGFTIVEYNGVSSEPTHILARDMTVKKAYRDYFATIAASFAIGAEYRRKGWKPGTFGEIYRMQTREWALLKQYPQGKEV